MIAYADKEKKLHRSYIPHLYNYVFNVHPRHPKESEESVTDFLTNAGLNSSLQMYHLPVSQK